MTLWIVTAGAPKLGPHVAHTSPFALTTAAYSRHTSPCSLVGMISEPNIPTPSPWSTHLVLAYFPKKSILTSFCCVSKASLILKVL